MTPIVQPYGVITEIKRIDGKPAVRFEHTPAGAWKVARSEIDAILEHVHREIPKLQRGVLLAAVNIHNASVSRCRHGSEPIQDSWLLRLQDFSGIPVSELRYVACMEPAPAHEHARRAA